MEINYWQSLQPLLEGLLKDMVEEETKYPLDSKISDIFNKQEEKMVEQCVEKWLSQTRLTFRKINFLSNFTKTINDLKKQTHQIQEIQKNFEQVFKEVSIDYTLNSECSRLSKAMKKICQTTLSSKTLIPKNSYCKLVLNYQESIEELAQKISQTYQSLLNINEDEDENEDENEDEFVPRFGIYKLN